MSEKERIIKLTWGIKKHENKFKILHEYTENDIVNTINSLYKDSKKGKTDKLEIITAIEQKDGIPKYKHYYFDSKTDFKYEECSVNIKVKSKNNNKSITFDEKVELLKSWLKSKNTIPEPGSIERGFDVGKFYQQTINNADKMNEVISAVEQYTNN